MQHQNDAPPSSNPQSEATTNQILKSSAAKMLSPAYNNTSTQLFSFDSNTVVSTHINDDESSCCLVSEQDTTQMKGDPCKAVAKSSISSLEHKRKRRKYKKRDEEFSDTVEVKRELILEDQSNQSDQLNSSSDLKPASLLDEIPEATIMTTAVEFTPLTLPQSPTSIDDLLDEDDHQTIHRGEDGDGEDEDESETTTPNRKSSHQHSTRTASLNRPIKLNQVQQDQLYSLIKIIRNGDYNEFMELLNSSGSRELLNFFVDGHTALHYSLIYGRSLAWCKQLVLNGANPNLTNRDGWHPIHLAAFKGSRETMRYLIDCIAY